MFFKRKDKMMYIIVGGMLCVILTLLLLLFLLVKVAKDRDLFAEHLLDEIEMVREFFKLRQSGMDVERCLSELGYNEIAIWGIDRLGSLIYRELQRENVNVKYCIDDTISNHYDISVDIYYPLAQLPKVDAVLCINKIPKRWREESKRWGMPVINLTDLLRRSIDKS